MFFQAMRFITQPAPVASMQTHKSSEGYLMVAIRNPHAHQGDEWTGNFCDADLAANHPELMEELGHDCCEDGTFWMEMNDFIR